MSEGLTPRSDSKGQRPLSEGVECAGEDLILHGLLRPLGPQPSASTNSATSARGNGSVAAVRRRDGLCPALPTAVRLLPLRREIIMRAKRADFAPLPSASTNSA